MMIIKFRHYDDGNVLCSATDANIYVSRVATRHEGATVEERAGIAAKRARASLYALMAENNDLNKGA
jgi:hypothetical protein